MLGGEKVYHLHAPYLTYIYHKTNLLDYFGIGQKQTQGGELGVILGRHLQLNGNNFSC